MRPRRGGKHVAMGTHNSLLRLGDGVYLEVIAIDPDNLTTRYNFACNLANLLGDDDAALDMLGPVLERDPGGLLQDTRYDPDFAGLRDDPRFQAMIADAEARLAAAKPADGLSPT